MSTSLNRIQAMYLAIYTLLFVTVFSMPTFATEKCATPDQSKITTTVSNNIEVWWGNRGKSFGNYLEFSSPNLPESGKESQPKVLAIVYFELDKSDITKDAKAILKDVAKYLHEHPDVKVLIEGHCCDLHTEEYNQKLGLRRAESVRKFLIGQGIAANRMEVVSYGESRLVTHKKEDRWLNRRAVIVTLQQ